MNGFRTLELGPPRSPALGGETDADCVPRFGTACCEPCGAPAEELVAIASTKIDELLALVCEPGEVCDACVPAYPDYPYPLCGDGHCFLYDTSRPEPP